MHVYLQKLKSAGAIGQMQNCTSARTHTHRGTLSVKLKTLYRYNLKVSRKKKKLRERSAEIFNSHTTGLFNSNTLDYSTARSLKF